MSVFDTLIGQDHAVEQLQRASADARDQSGSADAMSHAWLLTGPPGSGRSTLGLAFAASLVCAADGCGRCADCSAVAAGMHSDVEHVVPAGVIYSTADADALVERASLAPRQSPWHIIVVEDFDRFQLNAVPKLLKAIEEPPARTVWVLCAPTAEDVLPTIRSRCRHVVLGSPTIEQVAEQLSARFGVDAAAALAAARAAQGHIGRARALATDSSARQRRAEVLAIPGALRTVSACFAAAAQIVDTVAADVEADAAALEQVDETNVRTVWGDGAEGVKSVQRMIKRELKDAERRFRDRRRRMTADHYDRALLDLTGYYRDVLVLQSAAAVPLINEEFREALQRAAQQSDSTATLARIDAIRETRDNLFANVAPLAAFESLFVALRDVAVLDAGR